jgi:acyl-CoA thioesterase-1
MKLMHVTIAIARFTRSARRTAGEPGECLGSSAGSPTDDSITLRDVARGRRGSIALTLLCAVLAVVFAYFELGAVHPANSARTESRSAAATRDASVRDGASLSAALARNRPTTYRIAFFGDSVSVGFGASDQAHTYVAHVVRWLKTHRKRVIETVHAKGGVPVAYWMDARMPRQLDAAVVELGTNDVRLGTPAAQFAREYRTLTARIRTTSPRAQLLCLSTWSRPEGANLEGVINTQIRSACPGAYINITRLRDRPRIRSRDGFHPNNLGYRLIARAVEAKLGTP